jgi:hypothetical protein
MHSEQVARIGCVLVDARGDAGRNAMRLSQFHESGENNLLFGETTNAVFERCLVDDMIGKAELFLENSGVKG